MALRITSTSHRNGVHRPAVPEQPVPPKMREPDPSLEEAAFKVLADYVEMRLEQEWLTRFEVWRAAWESRPLHPEMTAEESFARWENGKRG